MKDLVTKVSALSNSGETANALDMVFETIDQMCHAGQFAEINQILTEMDVPKTDLDILIGFLTITFAANEHLPYREEFFQKVKKQAIAQDEYERGILTGLSTKEDFWSDSEEEWWKKRNLP